MAQNKTQNVNIRYDKSEVVYATQFLASPSHEELLIDFASGTITEDEGRTTLPIHTRLAMPWSAVERLTQILNQVVQKRKQASQKTSEKYSKQIIPRASLPSMSPQTASQE
ncbi:MAG: DUF3467 domain-containing protein [Planctomycetota bacterium]